MMAFFGVPFDEYIPIYFELFFEPVLGLNGPSRFWLLPLFWYSSRVICYFLFGFSGLSKKKLF